ncbi:Uncharacterised protein [Plesiomonas shigelloides]|nr:Uncharacterised protein [Plesiomonas shigelloides]
MLNGIYPPLNILVSLLPVTMIKQSKNRFGYCNNAKQCHKRS